MIVVRAFNSREEAWENYQTSQRLGHFTLIFTPDDQEWRLQLAGAQPEVQTGAFLVIASTDRPAARS
jgi:hypothetical protein